MRALRSLRGVDHVLGAAALRVLAIRKRRTVAWPERVERIGILQTAAIGDTLLMSRALGSIRDHWREAHLTFFAGPSNVEAARFLPGVDALERIDVFRFFESLRTIRRVRLDLCVDFGPWPRINALYAALSGAAVTAGFRTPGQHRHYCQDISVEHRSDRHEESNQLALAEALGAEAVPRPSLTVPPVHGPLPELPRPYVVIHPWPGGSAAREKRWTEAGWLALAKWLHAQGHHVVISGSDADRPGSETLAGRMKAADTGLDPRSIAGCCGLAELAHVLRGAAAVVSVDTGIMHLAGALGCPTVSLHGPTRAARWGARGNCVVPVEAEGDDCGYIHLGFERPDPDPRCMERISPERVIEALKALI